MISHLIHHHLHFIDWNGSIGVLDNVHFHIGSMLLQSRVHLVHDLYTHPCRDEDHKCDREWVHEGSSPVLNLFYSQLFFGIILFTLWAARFLSISVPVALLAQIKNTHTMNRSMRYWKLKASSTKPRSMLQRSRKKMESRREMLKERRARGRRK